MYPKTSSKKHQPKHKTNILLFIILPIIILNIIRQTENTETIFRVLKDDVEITYQHLENLNQCTIKTMENLSTFANVKKAGTMFTSDRIYTRLPLMLIILSNDVHPCPGPQPPYACTSCNKMSTPEDSVQCETCNMWSHLSCTGYQNNIPQNRSFNWICPNTNCKPNHCEISKPANEAAHNHNQYVVISKEKPMQKLKRPQIRTKSTGRVRMHGSCLLKELPKISSKDYQGKDLCRSCSKEVSMKQQAIFCDHCERWIHRSCSDMSIRSYNQFKKIKSFSWTCNKCRIDDILVTDKADLSRINKSDLPEHIQEISQSNKELLIIHINCRSLVNKFEELVAIIEELYPDIICLTETWFDDSIPKQAYIPEGYSIIRKDRDETFKQRYGRNKGGGIAVLYKKHIKVEKKTYLTDKQEEILWVHVKVKQSFMLGTIYRAEYTDLLNEDQEETKIEENIRKAAEISNNILITGDFNIDMLQPESRNTKKLMEIYQSYGLDQCINKPTRIDNTSHKPAILDHVWASTEANLIKNSGTFHGISDHMGIYMKLNKNKPPLPDSKIIFRNFKNYNPNEFNTELAEKLENSQIEEHLLNDDVNLAAEELVKTIQDTAQNHAPLTEVRQKDRKKNIPWVTNELKDMIRQKNELLQDYYECGRAAYKKRLKQLSNSITQMKRNLKKAYITEKMDEAKGDSKKCWKLLDSISNRTKVKEKTEPDMMTQEKANQANNFFATVGLKIQEQCQSNVEENVPEQPIPHGAPANLNSFSFKPETSSKVEKLIDNIRSDVAIGEDTIGARLIKDMKHTITPILTKILNKGYETNTFPNNMKKALIKAIHKKGNPDDISNYRPISILPTLSKIFERAAVDQLMTHLEDNKLLSENQHAYRKNHSTVTCLAEVINYVHRLIDKKKYTAIASLDLSKAFDSIKHKLLLKKLRKLGLSENSVQWIGSYLKSRKQRTKFNNYTSQEETVYSGIPQGSILGPLLFLCFTNDFHDQFNEDFKTIAYADDTQIIVEAKTLTQLKTKVQEGITLAQKWYQSNTMKNNIGKTEVIVFNNNRKSEYLQIKVVDEGKEVKIKSQESITILGVIIDNNLNWKKQVNDVKKKSMNVTRNIHRINHLLPIENRMDLYHAVISPQFSYADIIWGGCGQQEAQSLQRVQNFAAKSITGNRKYDSATESLRKLKLLNLKQRRSVHETVFVHKALLQKNTAKINEEYNQLIPTTNTRFAKLGKLKPPIHKTSKFEKSPLYRSIISWNSCPNHLPKDNIKNHKIQLQKHRTSKI